MKAIGCNLVLEAYQGICQFCGEGRLHGIFTPKAHAPPVKPEINMV